MRLFGVILVVSTLPTVAAVCEDLPTPRGGFNRRPWTFAVISDSHIKDTSKERDTKQAKRKLEAVGRELSSMSLDFVVHTGDHVNDLYCPALETCLSYCTYKEPQPLCYDCCSCDFNCYGDQYYRLPLKHKGHHSRCPPKVLLDYAGIVHESFSDVPKYYMVLGNHDDRILSKFVIRTRASHAWGRVFGLEKSDVYPALPAVYSDSENRSFWEVSEYAGFQLLMLNSSAERPKHESEDPDYNDGLHLGAEQREWLTERLSDHPDRSAVLFWHRMLHDDGFDVNKHEVLRIVQKHKTKIKAVFTGHSHHFWKYTWEGIPFYQTTSTVCDIAPNYFHVRLNTDGSVEVLNEKRIFENPLATKACEVH